MMKLSAVAMSISRVMMFWVMSSSVMISKAPAEVTKNKAADNNTTGKMAKKRLITPSFSIAIYGAHQIGAHMNFPKQACPAFAVAAMWPFA
jgi:hypothetical protein